MRMRRKPIVSGSIYGDCAAQTPSLLEVMALWRPICFLGLSGSSVSSRFHREHSLSGRGRHGLRVQKTSQPLNVFESGSMPVG